MLDWIERFMDATGCDWDTAAREYQAIFRSDSYEPEDYE